MWRIDHLKVVDTIIHYLACVDFDALARRVDLTYRNGGLADRYVVAYDAE
jgi:hypothetical protein